MRFSGSVFAQNNDVLALRDVVALRILAYLHDVHARPLLQVCLLQSLHQWESRFRQAPLHLIGLTLFQFSADHSQRSPHRGPSYPRDKLARRIHWRRAYRQDALAQGTSLGASLTYIALFLGLFLKLSQLDVAFVVIDLVLNSVTPVIRGNSDAAGGAPDGGIHNGCFRFLNIHRQQSLRLVPGPFL